MNTASPRVASDDDTHDQIGSISTTPSGVATPHPDPSDKRLPGILHSYFGQVRERPFTSPSDLKSSSQSHFITAMENGETASKVAFAPAKGVLPTAPSTPSETDTVAFQHPLPPGDISRQGIRHDRITVPPYPTPPTSSSSSSIRKASEAGSDVGTQTNETDTSTAHPPSLTRQSSGNNIMPLRTRRQTASMNPLSNITTSSSVYATHLSNPTLSNPSTRPSTPTADIPTISALSSLTSHLESTKLTDGVASPRKKNTPPLTPRALSNDGSESARKTPPTPERGNERSGQHGAHNSPMPRSSPPVGPPKGKLFVTISGARGLRACYNPYAVCAFEEIESIAKPRDVEAGSAANIGEQPMGGVPIQRSGSDMGRSIAIPMKSRQSSTTSLDDHKDFKNGRQVTNPRWDHVAVL